MRLCNPTVAVAIAAALLLLPGLLLPGCFDPDVSANFATDTETGAGSESGNAMTSMTMTSSDPSSGDSDPTGPGTACVANADCAAIAAECEVASCRDDGTCVVANAAAGASCGAEKESDCDAADTCDGSGQCLPNLAADGTDCTECSSGQCTCTAGACDECVVFADTNLFTTDRALAGWELTGDWGLYTVAPPSNNGTPAVEFGNRVLGTDGNRHFPYPGVHAERSYARTPPTELPTELRFQSWHVDEGAASYDNKIIRVSTDGGATWEDIISCPLDPELPFCQGISERNADDWDMISLTLPAPLVGQIGIIEFAYDTFDSCCNFEQGWYIDVTNFATECQCTVDATCSPYGTQCGTGACGRNGACNLEDTKAAGTLCGDAMSDACTMPDTCDSAGDCRGNHVLAEANGQVIDCGNACPAGSDCVGCSGGVCEDCPNLPELQDFESVPFAGFVSPLSLWTLDTTTGGGYTTFFQIPAPESGGTVLQPERSPFFGVDGNTQEPSDGIGQINIAAAHTPVVFGTTLDFSSWHVDEGGQANADVKAIEISVDEGTSWIPLADCGGGALLNGFPFCEVVMDRDADDWDSVSLDVSRYTGMDGLVRFRYDTVTDCCGFERGWFIDDLNFAQTCAAPNSSLGSDCQFQFTAEQCNDNNICAWDAAAGECISCFALGVQADCEDNPLCEWRSTAGGGAQPVCSQALWR